jgi:sugar-specific transcriptional regulator TrmB
MDFSIFGLDNRDKRIYEALVNYPQSSIRNIADITGINRGSVFESIKNLVGVGLVIYIETGDRKKYSAQNPEILHELVNERRRKMLESHISINDYIDSFDLKRLEPNIKSFASYYDGDEGLANILRDLLSTARRQNLKEYYSISSPRVSEYLYNRFRHFSRERDKLGLKVKIIGLGQPVTAELPSATRRILHNPSADKGVYTLIYGNKVALATINETKHTSGIIIDNGGIASLQAMLFEQMWDILGK